MTAKIDRAIHNSAVRAANRFSRRGFLGRVGTATAALGTGGMVAWVPTAEALCSGESVTCATLWGNNSCPSGTCDDGSWCVGSGCDWLQQNCNGGMTKWSDCCIRKSECSCHTASGYPTCCNDCVWGQVCNKTDYTVRCRRHSCC
jgi:hypothetical protein